MYLAGIDIICHDGSKKSKTNEYSGSDEIYLGEEVT